MKIRSSFIRHDSDGESMLIPTGDASFSGIVKGNPTLGAIIDLMSEDTTEEEVVAKMREKYNAPEGVIERDVSLVIDKLRSIGALDE